MLGASASFIAIAPAVIVVVITLRSMEIAKKTPDPELIHLYELMLRFLFICLVVSTVAFGLALVDTFLIETDLRVFSSISFLVATVLLVVVLGTIIGRILRSQ